MKKTILTLLVVLMCVFASLSFSQELPKKIVSQDTIGLLLVTNDTIKFILIDDLNRIDTTKTIFLKKEIEPIRIDTTAKYKIYENKFYGVEKK